MRYHDHRYPLAPGTAGDDVLAVHAAQHYELVHWTRADAELNYRRFFAVNELAAVRVELPEVFDATHREILRWVREGLVDGLRVDHPDGLADPGGYLDRLATATGGAYVLVEKILESGEALPPFWATAGTTGYDALAELDRVLVDPAGRAALAATLSPVYGIYSGFELCENAAIPGKEEYLDSEKYQFKGRDWNAPGNIKDYIARLNAVRRANRALQEYTNLRFHPAENDNILFFSKATAAQDNVILCAITVDPVYPQTAFVHVPLQEFGIGETETYQVEDLLTGEKFFWTGSRNFISLNPHTRPAHIFRLRRKAGRDQGEDVFV